MDLLTELKLPQGVILSGEVARSISLKLPILAFESTVITHGLTYPENLSLAQDMEAEARRNGVTPATIAALDGHLLVGLQPAQLERLATERNLHKISTRDLGPAIARRWSGGTTVAGTLAIAHLAGIQVFATGGIGGVHRGTPFDVSADLPALSQTPLVVVCAGAKAILDLPATLEYLETAAVPVVGYGTNDFPAFYSRQSGLKVTVRADTIKELVDIIRSHWKLGAKSAVLVVNPPPESVALSRDEVETAIQQALNDAKAKKIHGQEVTPFLLQRMVDLTQGASLKANLGLLLNNARLGAEIARSLSTSRLVA